MRLLACHVTRVIILLLALGSALAEDFYQLLGVSRQANAREIRKAFKKIALEKHPDKNTDDPNANDLFVRINRAYEVLKDEDLRKKYDQFGEDGLKEDGPSGRGFHSWNFYKQDFGIYDEDQEIITLNKADFEQSVENTKDIWFVNFYSPRCSHCHETAPSWREMARELEGVLRIGAVNCGDEWALCRQLGIRSYPTLAMFPKNEKYSGQRQTDLLVEFALKHVGATMHKLTPSSFDAQIKKRNTLPWLISYCGDGGDCLEASTSTKVAAMLSDLVNVGLVDCHVNTAVCDQMGVDHGTYFYETGKVLKGQGSAISSLFAREVALAILALLPDLAEAKGSDIEQSIEKKEAMLVHFVEGQVTDLDLRKLPVLLSPIKVWRLDCKQSRSLCNNLHVHKFPTYTVFKKGGGHEIHHGRQTAHDIAAFAKDSAETPVRVLSPKDFPAATQSAEPWFIDFYAPWCPPCMRLLPEFRKASKEMSNIHFGTVDCSVHGNLCSQYGVKSYPTTMFYNQSTPHQFDGHHHASHIVEFLQDMLNPPVVSLDADSFDKLVIKRSKDELWLVDFFAPWCGPCRQLEPEWRQLAKATKTHSVIRVGSVNCDQHKAVCTKYKVQSYPNIRAYVPGKQGTTHFQEYNQFFRDAQSIRSWAQQLLPSKVINLNPKKFQEILSSKEPWVVDFFAPWCGPCQMFAPEFENVATMLEGRVKAGKVNCDQYGSLCQQVGLRGYPTVRFYIGSSGKKQASSGEDLRIDTAQIMRYIDNRVRSKNLILEQLLIKTIERIEFFAIWWAQCILVKRAIRLVLKNMQQNYGNLEYCSMSVIGLLTKEIAQ
ncbi:hypothetical protein CAPTEDRAFT_228052 [Capitella teleta]|uniref:DnaJ homolog subfamily C member 10 n=1 Tax=Capitella teleta TaxID=283909 RepID=R7TG96_CAPTE|nr:hypothetical protein CAPTEDRAFT_228052 [Capitella teleta]|eukprot:ELT92793.1 hypothetical protein CAPTEDRAFT_228052 [Capitella teleta]